MRIGVCAYFIGIHHVFSRRPKLKVFGILGVPIRDTLMSCGLWTLCNDPEWKSESVIDQVTNQLTGDIAVTTAINLKG